MMVSVLYIPWQPTNVVVVFKWSAQISLSTMIQYRHCAGQCQGHREQQIKMTTWLSILIVMQTKKKITPQRLCLSVRIKLS